MRNKEDRMVFTGSGVGRGWGWEDNNMDSSES